MFGLSAARAASISVCLIGLMTAGLALAQPASQPGSQPSAQPAAKKPAPEILIDHASVKVVKITLGVGGVLPEHTTPVDATVAAMAGQGEVTIGGKAQALPGHGAVFLPKGIPHAVKNTGKDPLVLLVHHLKTTK